MSEPQTPPSIEDVLSSIRRLVSQGDRGPRPAPETAPAPGAEPGALVLTPSLRVAAPAGADEAPFFGADDGTLLLDETHAAHDGLEATVRDPATSPDEAWDAAAEDTAPDRSPEPGREAPHSDIWPDDDDLAALARLDGADPDQPDPAGADLGDAPLGDADDAAPAVPRGDAPAADRTALEATIAELEAAVTRQVDEWEPDGTEPDVEVDWSVADTGAAAFFSSRLAQRADGAPPLTLTNPEPPLPPARPAAIDREALRQLVAEVVREELAGELGQRITRNVRRLVRREVSQALALRDLG